MIFGIVYLATCSVSNKSYVGQTFSNVYRSPEELLRKRRIRHESEALRENKTHFHNAISKYGPDAFVWEILHVLDSVDALNAAEEEEVNKRKTLSDDNGYNAICGGGNRKASRLTKLRMSNSAKNRWSDPQKRKELRQAISAGRARHIERISKIWSASAKKTFSDPDVRARANEGIRRALNTPEYKTLRAKLTRARWQSLSDEQKRAHLERMKSNESVRKESAKKALQNPEYKKLASERSRKRFARPFEVLDASTLEVVGVYSNSCDAAMELEYSPALIAACVRGKIKTFAFGRYKAYPLIYA